MRQYSQVTLLAIAMSVFVSPSCARPPGEPDAETSGEPDPQPSPTPEPAPQEPSPGEPSPQPPTPESGEPSPQPPTPEPSPPTFALTIDDYTEVVALAILQMKRGADGPVALVVPARSGSEAEFCLDEWPNDGAPSAFAEAAAPLPVDYELLAEMLAPIEVILVNEADLPPSADQAASLSLIGARYYWFVYGPQAVTGELAVHLERFSGEELNAEGDGSLFSVNRAGEWVRRTSFCRWAA